MNRKHFAVLMAPLVAIAIGCASERIPPPQALVDARADYVRARDGMASRLAPADLHQADLALQDAERAYAEAPGEPATAELATIADRKALYAQSQAATVQAQQDLQKTNAELQAARASRLEEAQRALGVTQLQLEQQAATAAEQRARLQELEEKLSDAHATIAQIAMVKEDERGMVITLPGEVLFTTAKWDLKPAAMAKLDQIARALMGKDQPIVVIGYTDNVGGRDSNLTLSRNRAEAVRDYLVAKGIPKDLLEARGMGPDNPMADNDSVEGRAQNRRVEIVVQPKK